MAKRSRYQNGWMEQVTRKGGTVWVYRYRDYDAAGVPVKRSLTVGTIEKYPNESEALRAVELKRLEINKDAAGECPAPLMTVALLCAHYRKIEIEEDEDNDERKASTTKDRIDSIFKLYIIPKWGSYRLAEVRTIAVKDWLKTLTTSKGKRMARGTKAKVRNTMSALWSHAIAYEMDERNPVTEVRQSAKREKVPEILTVEEFRSLLDELTQMHRAMVFIDAATGLRRSELFALKWSDIDFDTKQASVTRSIVFNTKRERVGDCKTEASQKPVPLDDVLLEELELWRLETSFPKPEHWVWASPTKKGQMPLNPQNVMTDYIRPAAVKAGITKTIGWHTFRHSYTSLLKSNGEDIKVVQELLRHANSRITLDVYAQALSPAKRDAQSKVVQMILPRKRA